MTCKTLITSGILTLMAASAAPARDMVIAIPGTLPADRKDALVKQAVTHLLNIVAPGEQGHLLDAATGHVLAAFTIPEGDRYANPRAKLAANPEAMRALKDFMTAPGDGTGQVNLPDLLNRIAVTLPARGSAGLILIADPRSTDPLAPSLDMTGGAVPGDGHIAAPRGRSPFGTADLRGTLAGYDVYLGAPAPDWAVSTAHGPAVERFWELSVTARGGSWQMLGDDLATLYALAAQDAPDHPPRATLVPTDKLEMIRFAPDTGAALDLYAAPVAEAPAPAPLWAAARDVSVGLSWDCARCDLDLYLRPNPAAEVLYFSNTRSAQGQHLKDHLSSPSLTNGYETVALNGAVDLSQVQISVNHYSGTAADPITAELRIAIGDQVWAHRLTLPAGAGNGGAGAEQVLVAREIPNASWAILDPMTVLGAQ